VSTIRHTFISVIVQEIFATNTAANDMIQMTPAQSTVNQSNVAILVTYMPIILDVILPEPETEV